MTTHLDTLARELVKSVIIGVGFTLPVLILALILLRIRKGYQLASHEPFTQLPLRPPGESLRIQIEELSERFDSMVFTLGFTALIGIVFFLTAPATAKAPFAVGSLLLITGVTIVVGKRMLTLARKLWDLRLGFMGERVVGEELNQLLASGFRVFHDVVFDRYNIDHVLVGPPGVYAIETKARRKPADVKGLEKAKVYSDGARLRFPKGKFTDDWIPQARLNAQTLGKWLTQATGEPTAVNAILTIPGWSVEREKPSDVNVLRPDEIKRSFPTRPRQPLTPERIQQISYQLEQRCRLPKEAKPAS